jgi:heme exporter protein D
MDAVKEFFHMGGYALYVWGSFGVTALLMIVEPLLLARQRKEMVRRLRRLARLETEQSS